MKPKLQSDFENAIFRFFFFTSQTNSRWATVDRFLFQIQIFIRITNLTHRFHACCQQFAIVIGRSYQIENYSHLFSIQSSLILAHLSQLVFQMDPIQYLHIYTNCQFVHPSGHSLTLEYTIFLLLQNPRIVQQFPWKKKTIGFGNHFANSSRSFT